MKKSFMTRALATGLSLAMAFSLTAATNVTTAAAAAKPAMKASQMTVKEGKSKTFLATAKTLKTYKITKAKVKNASAKKYISVKKNAKGTGIVVTGKKGADTARKIVITFQNKKTKKTTNLTAKVVVKTVEPVVVPQSIVKAEVTGVKTVTLTMANDVASVASPVAITVKKNTSDRPCKATADGKTITLAMDAKLTQGAYTVSITGLEDTALTAEFNVEKDETLTSFSVSDYLVAQDVDTTTVGSIKFAALNQYGEKMNASDPTVTCSFGKVTNNNKPSKSASATAEGVITVEDINAVLAIPGTKGVVTLVGDMGVTATKEISYNTFAKATKAEVVGIYNKNTAALTTLKEDDKASDYELLLKVIDQYDSEMSQSDFANKQKLRVTISGGLTGLSVDKESNDSAFSTRTYDGNDYIAVNLAATSSKILAGDATLIVTGNYSGMLINDKITVAKNVVVKSANITADNGIYWGQENTLNYEFIDQDGNAITDYVTLVENCGVTFSNGDGYLRFERQDDGKAKLIADLTNPTGTEPSQSNTDKASKPFIVTCYANSQTGGEYLVKTFSLTVNESRVAKGVTGVKDDVTLAISAKNTKKNLTIKSTDIVLADQYSNPLKDDEKAFNKTMVAASAAASITSGTSVFVKQNATPSFNVAVVDNKIVATPTAVVGNATVYLKYKYTTDTTKQTNPVASDRNYDAKFVLTAYDTKSVDVSTLFIDSIKDGCDVTSGAADKMDVDDIVVKAKVGGVNTVIPADQYVITDKGAYNWTNEELSKGVETKKATLKIQVTTWDASNTPISTELTKEYTVSRAKSKLFKVDSTVVDTVGVAISGNVISGNSLTLASPVVIKGTDFVKQFKFKDQYGLGANTVANLKADTSKLVGGDLDTGSVTYKITVLSSGNKDAYEISHNGTNQARIVIVEKRYCKFKVTVTAPDGSSKSVTYVVGA